MSPAVQANPLTGTPYRYQCIVCLQLDAEALYDPCPGCKARLFGEYVAVKGGL